MEGKYKKLGFKAGLEIHQQLETHKLFCSCPSLVNDTNKPDMIIKRKLRASAGETGKLDVAAKFEMQKDKTFIYESCSTSSCLVELDEEPPHKLNKEALEVALQIALLLDAKIVDEIQIMRKIVVDGSNVSGFQRTMLIATDGILKTEKGTVKVPIILLEEEAAKKIKETDKEVTYRLDRLGVPLIEISTDASIKDPEHVKEVAAKIGMILRSTGKAKRGIGTIRQDVNVSIKGHPRIEIKGFQDLRNIVKVVENEVKRQINNVKEKKELKSEVRKLEQDNQTSFSRPMPGSARMYPETDIPPIKITKKLLDQIEIPELITERAINFEKKYNLSPKLAREIINLNIPFDYYAEKFTKLNPSLIAQVLIEIPKEIKSRFNADIENLSQKNFEFVLNNLELEKISKEAVLDILLNFAQGKQVDLNQYKKQDISNLEKDIKIIVDKNKGASFNAVMGEIMKQFRGKVDGKEVARILKKLL